MDEEKIETVETVTPSSEPLNFEEETLKRTIANLEREIKQNREKITLHKDLIVVACNDRDARLRNHDIMIASKFKPVNAQWEFQLDPEYGANLSVIQSTMRRQDELNYKMTIEQLEKVVKVSEEQLVSLESEYKSLTGKEPVFD